MSESNLVAHAHRELELLGEDMTSSYVQSMLDAIKAFSSEGHSGGSAMIAIEILHRLLKFEHLSPLTADPAEWIDHSDRSSAPLWQSARNPKAFSTDGGATYYVLDEEPRQMHATEPVKEGTL